MLGSSCDFPWSKDIVVVAGSILRYFYFLSSCPKALREHKASFPMNTGSHMAEAPSIEAPAPISHRVRQWIQPHLSLTENSVQRPHCPVCKLCLWDPKEDPAGIEGGGKERKGNVIFWFNSLVQLSVY